MNRFLTLAFSALLLSLSSLYGQTVEKEEYNIRSQENALERPGMLVGTITINNTSNLRHSYELIIRASDREMGKTIIKIIPRKYRKKKFQPDYWDGKKAVYVVVWKRSEGEYHFSDVTMWHVANRYDPEIDCRFTVKENMITYFGNIEINDGERTTTVADLKSRDLSLIRQKYPNSNWSKYKNGNMILEASPLP